MTKAMSPVLRARMGGTERAAKYSREQVREMTAVGRNTFRANLERRITDEYGLDPAAEDYRKRLDAGITNYYRRLRARRVAQ